MLTPAPVNSVKGGLFVRLVHVALLEAFLLLLLCRRCQVVPAPSVLARRRNAWLHLLRLGEVGMDGIRQAQSMEKWLLVRSLIIFLASLAVHWQGN